MGSLIFMYWCIDGGGILFCFICNLVASLSSGGGVLGQCSGLCWGVREMWRVSSCSRGSLPMESEMFVRVMSCLRFSAGRENAVSGR